MDNNGIKAGLRAYYDIEASHRNAGETQEWKIQQRGLFMDHLRRENKKSLLELGAGAGRDSQFFMDCGLDVVAVDLSGEMVKLCREKSIEAYEMDFYNISHLSRSFDAVWSMNSLLHVPKADLPSILRGVNMILNDAGLFYMGVYGGRDSEQLLIRGAADLPRFFAAYSKDALREVLSNAFDIIEYRQIDVNIEVDFQSVILRKKSTSSQDKP